MASVTWNASFAGFVEGGKGQKHRCSFGVQANHSEICGPIDVAHVAGL